MMTSVGGYKTLADYLVSYPISSIRRWFKYNECQSHNAKAFLEWLALEFERNPKLSILRREQFKDR